MTYVAKNFEHLLGIEGLSNQLLKNHFLLYQGYVNNINKLVDILNRIKTQKNGISIEYSEVKRRFGWEFNGMRLHEFYFGNIINGGAILYPNTNLYKKIIDDFGSFDEWKKDFKDTGMIRGVGWVVLYFEPTSNKLFNMWVNEHDSGHICTGFPILVMDVFEHAFMQDYGTNRANYIEAFFNIIDWTTATSLSDSWFSI